LKEEVKESDDDWVLVILILFYNEKHASILKYCGWFFNIFYLSPYMRSEIDAFIHRSL
tara:strand:+ start:172 stop:345 length:174 start_codon:yes stop_codon:yes gene_type:complete